MTGAQAGSLRSSQNLKNYMKKIKQIFLALVCAFFIAGCGASEQTKSPTETLKSLSEASKKRDAQAVKSHFSKGTLAMIEQSANRQEKTVDELLQQENWAVFQDLPEMKNEKISGETATVEVKNEVTGGYEEIPFNKEDGVWKVALDKYMQNAIKRLTEEMNKAPANMPANIVVNAAPPKSEANKSNVNSGTNKK